MRSSRREELEGGGECDGARQSESDEGVGDRQMIGMKRQMTSRERYEDVRCLEKKMVEIYANVMTNRMSDLNRAQKTVMRRRVRGCVMR